MAKSIGYWPYIDKEIENMVKSCTACSELPPTRPANSLIPHPIPTTTWYTLGADIFFLHKKIYLCVVDYHSKFLIVKELLDNSTHSLKEAFKDMILERGIFRELVSDAGMNFTSDEFQKFRKMQDIKSKMISSYQHGSNGQVKNYIIVIKQTYKKCL